MSDHDPLDPSGIAQFVEHDRCPRYIKQRVTPGNEPEARDWREAFTMMNVALLGNGREFEATQVEALAADATKVIGPDLNTSTTDGVPSITVDETWDDSTKGRAEQLRTAVAEAQTLTSNTDDPPYILCYQAPLGGQLGAEPVWGEVDCLTLAPATTSEENSNSLPPEARNHTDPAVLARVVDIKSASEEQPAHRVQVAIYSALLEQTLAEGPAPPCRIETSVLTQSTAAAPDTELNPFTLPTFRREEWELFADHLLAADGPIDEALTTDLGDLPFSLDQVCNNCAYREACGTRAVEDPTAPASLALLGLDASVQQSLHEHDITNIRKLSTLLSRLDDPHPTDEPPELDLDPDIQRALEQALPGPVHETVQRAQALRGKVDPDYPSAPRPLPIPGNDWVPLPDDRCRGWSNIDGATPGELIHVALFVRPDSAIDRVAALGACVSAGAHDQYQTVGEVIDAVPDDPDVADTVERALFERFLTQVFDAVETVADAVGDPADAVIHCYTYADHDKTALAEGLDRHTDLEHARALRQLLSLDPDGHTDVDQDMCSAVQPVINEHFALQYPSQGLLTVAEQFVPNWNVNRFDPVEARAGDPPLRAIFSEQFLNERVPYLAADPGLRLHLARGPLGEGPAVAAADTSADTPTPDGWYPVRKRAGSQFPLEYIWAAVPEHPGDETPRLTPDRVAEWGIDEDDRALYTQEINRFYYRTRNQDEPLQRADVEYLAERLSYTLARVVESIPYKDAYHEKTPLDVTRLADFSLPVETLPEAARDYLRMEFGAQRETIYDHYRRPLRDRARTGRSIPIRCTDIVPQEDGSLTMTGELAYDALFDAEVAPTVARQARIQSGDGPGGGSWRVLTGLRPRDAEDTTPADTENVSPAGPGVADSPSARGYTEAGVDDATDIQYSPPVLVDDLDHQTGMITLTAFPHRFQGAGSDFRVDHCGWAAPTASNLADPDAAPAERWGYVAGRPPVQVDTGELFMLDPMIDDFGAPKADDALCPETVEQNALWHHLQAVQRAGDQPPTRVATEAGVETFIDLLREADTCLAPNEDQQAFIRAVDRPVVPLQGPPGTGKTSGATAPALLARAFARSSSDSSFTGIVVAPSHEAVDAVCAGVTELLDDVRAAADCLETLELVRVLPTAPPGEDNRVDATTPHVDVSYCNYHSDAGETALEQLARGALATQHAADAASDQCLLFATPATLYRVFDTVASTLPAIDGTSAPAAMRHGAGFADVVCIDEASMLDVPGLLLAGSVLTPTGQTLLVGDHRQLPTVTQVDWAETLRTPITDTHAHCSAIDYIRQGTPTVTTATADRADHATQSDETTTGRGQTNLSEFRATDNPGAETGGASNDE